MFLLDLLVGQERFLMHLLTILGRLLSPWLIIQLFPERRLESVPSPCLSVYSLQLYCLETKCEFTLKLSSIRIFRVHLTLGNAIRIVPGFAGQLDHHTAIPFNCFNNGTRTGPSTCQCPDQFEGSNCAVPVCYYGGKVNPFPGNGNPLCLCPTGYSGDNCDQCRCME